MPPPWPPKSRLPSRPPSRKPPSIPPKPPQREGAGCGVIGWGRVGADGIGDTGAGEDGEESPREPRLPLEVPPPARAQASAVHSSGRRTISRTATSADVRFIVILLTPASTPHHSRSAIPSRARRPAPRP